MSGVRRTTLSNGTVVSTILRDDPVLLDLDSVIDKIKGREDLPYETMVFEDVSNRGYNQKEKRCERYQTEQQARHGHQVIVDEETRDTKATIVEEEDGEPDEETQELKERYMN